MPIRSRIIDCPAKPLLIAGHVLCKEIEMSNAFPYVWEFFAIGVSGYAYESRFVELFVYFLVRATSEDVVEWSGVIMMIAQTRGVGVGGGGSGR